MANLPNKYRQYLISKGKTSNEATEIVGDSTKIELQDDGAGAVLKSWNVSGIAQPSDSELAAVDSDANKLEALDVVHNNRKASYPSYAEQFDLIYHSGVDAWKAKIKETKDKYPKP